METIKLFEFSRLILLIKRQVNIHIKSYLVGMGAIAGFLLAVLFANLFSSGYMDTQKFTSVVLPFLFIGGCVFTSVIFGELNHPLKSAFFLMLPASKPEKLISGWFLSSVLYLVASIIMLYVMSILLSILGVAILSTEFFFINLLSASALKVYGVYMIVQTIFFVGALSFRNMNFLKTMLAAFISIAAISLFALLLSFLFYRDLYMAAQIDSVNFPGQAEYFFCGWFTKVVCAVFWGLTGPFFLIVAYFKLKERQV